MIRIDFIINRIREMSKIIPFGYRILAQNEINLIRRGSKYTDPKSLLPFGYKIFSQNDEDGIIGEIFKRIGPTNKSFIEFGAGNGLENNTLTLVYKGWNGLWIDSSSKYVNNIQKHYSKIINRGQIKVIKSFITKSNIDSILKSNNMKGEIDLLSIDIDGNDIYIFNAISCISPRVVIMEYNAKFIPPMIYCMAYEEKYKWKGDDCFGSSLKYLEIEFSKKGYSLVGCNLTGVNAFFIRNDLVSNKFMEPFSAEFHYEPPRYYLTLGLSTGHPSSYRTLDRAIDEI